MWKTILSERRVVAGLAPATPIVWHSAFTSEVAGTSPAMTLRRLFYVIGARLNPCPASQQNRAVLEKSALRLLSWAARSKPPA